MMLRNMTFLAAVTGGLAACGGGTSSNGDDQSITLTPDGGTLLRNAVAATVAINTPDGVSISGNVPTFSLAANGTITVTIAGGGTLNFAPGDAVTIADSGSTFFANNGNADGAAIADPATSSLDYSAFGIWIDGSSADLTTVNTAYTVTDAGAGFFGVLTAPADLPTTGTASYAGGAVATLSQGNQIQDLLNGTINGTANFASATVDMSIDLSQSNGGNFGTLTSTGMTIDGATSTFASTNGGAVIDTGHAGRLNGSFFGPVANEIAGQFDLSDGTTRVLGAFGGGS